MTKLNIFTEEQRDKCKLMDQEMAVVMARDKEEAEKRDVWEKAQHTLHHFRLDELLATTAEQDARIKELEAKFPSESSESVTPGAKRARKK